MKENEPHIPVPEGYVLADSDHVIKGDDLRLWDTKGSQWAPVNVAFGFEYGNKTVEKFNKRLYTYCYFATKTVSNPTRCQHQSKEYDIIFKNCTSCWCKDCGAIYNVKHQRWVYPKNSREKK